MRAVSVLAAAVALTTAVPAARAAGDNFFEGKSIRFILSAGEGGGYATYARVLSHHMGRHLPGNPTFVVQSMPGGGGLRATKTTSSPRRRKTAARSA